MTPAAEKALSKALITWLGLAGLIASEWFRKEAGVLLTVGFAWMAMPNWGSEPGARACAPALVRPAEIISATAREHKRAKKTAATNRLLIIQLESYKVIRLQGLNVEGKR